MRYANVKKLLLIVSSIIVLVFIAAFVLIRRIDNKFAVENRTSKTIARVQVDVCQLTYKFSNIAPGEIVWADHKAIGDSSYNIAGTLQDGTMFRGGGGYISNGYMGMRDVLVVHPGGSVEVNQSEIIP